MNSGFEIPGIQQHQQENNCDPVLLSTNPTHILEQIHTLPTTQQLFLNQHHFLSPHHPQSRLNHHFVGGTAASPAYFPVNFKLSLNEICSRNDYKESTVSSTNGGEDALLRGSKQCEMPEALQSSLGMLRCWQNPQDSANKQTPFWEPLPAEVSNENSEIVDRQDHLEMNQTPTTCSVTKSRVYFGELEAIYKRLGTAEGIQTCPSETVLPVNVNLPMGLDHRSEASTGEEALTRKRMKKKKKENSYNKLIKPMARYFGKLVKQVMDHQENLQQKFTEMIERLDEERTASEEAWRSQELANFEREAAARAHEKALAKSREAMIVSYVEKITGEIIGFH